MTPNLARLCFVFLLATASSAAAQSTQPTVAIVPAKAKGGPNLGPQLKPMVERPLKSQASIIPFKAFQKAARKAKVKPKDVATVSGATTIGAALELTHVVIVEGLTERIGEGKKKKAVHSAKVTVLAVDSGESLFTQSYVLKGKRLTKDVGQQIVADITPILAPPAEPEMPAPVEEVAPPPPEAPVADAQPPQDPSLEQPTGTPEPALENAGADPTLASADGAVPADDSVPADGAGLESGVPGDAAMTEAAPVPPEPEAAPSEPAGKRASWRPGLVARLGALGFVRNGTIEDDSATPALSYSPPDGGATPMPAGVVQLEVYPLAFGGTGKWYEGIGIDAEGSFTQVVTEVGATSTSSATEVTSTVFGGRGGLSLRFVLWDSETAADVKVRAGYGMFQFPLSEGSFPGVRFAGAYAGATVTVPLMRQLAIVVGLTYTPSLSVLDRAEDIGESLESGSGFTGETGLKLTFGALEVGLIGRMEQYSMAFTGPSSLDNVSYTDATFEDTYAGALLTGGYRF